MRGPEIYPETLPETLKLSSVRCRISRERAIASGASPTESEPLLSIDSGGSTYSRPLAVAFSPRSTTFVLTAGMPRSGAAGGRASAAAGGMFFFQSGRSAAATADARSGASGSGSGSGAGNQVRLSRLDRFVILVRLPLFRFRRAGAARSALSASRMPEKRPPEAGEGSGPVIVVFLLIPLRPQGRPGRLRGTDSSG